MAIEYPSLKVPDLKKLLQERGLVVSGNKAELISRLQEDDKKSGNAAAGEDEIDWDEDDKTTAIVPELVLPAVAQPVSEKAEVTEIEVPLSNIVEEPPSITETPTADKPPKSTENASNVPPAEDPNIVFGNHKSEFSIGLGQSDALKEAEKRAARAKRFSIPQNEEAIKRAERAKKFGLSVKDEVVEGLDAALPDRRPKRSREQKPSSRPDKRQMPYQRYNVKQKDSVEKAKAEARVKRFSRPAAA